MFLTELVTKAKFLLNENSGTILTGVGMSGTVVTAVLAGRASFKAAKIIEDENTEREDHDSVTNPLPKMTKVKLVWHLYIPPVAAGVITVTSIFMANRLSSKKIAALAIASGVSERALQEYKAKVVEKLTPHQEEKMRAEIAQERMDQYPPRAGEYIPGTGNVMCMDMLTGRYFYSTVEDIKRAENKINHALLHYMGGCSLAEFQDEIGLTPTSYTDSVGWSGAEHIEAKISTVLTPDQKPCIAVDITPLPNLEYTKQRHNYDD